jgi:hypothetical protein
MKNLPRTNTSAYFVISKKEYFVTFSPCWKTTETNGQAYLFPERLNEMQFDKMAVDEMANWRENPVLSSSLRIDSSVIFFSS